MGAALAADLFLGAPAFAVDPSKALTQYSHDNWTTREGLPQDTVESVAQGHDGYLWLATPVGLVRFDGITFTLYDKDNAGLPHDHMWGVFVAKDGTLWVSTDGGGVARVREGQVATFSTANGLSNDFVRPIREGPDGTIWIATRGGGLNRYRDGALSVIGTKQGLPSNLVWALHPDRDGGVWIGTNGGGLALMQDGKFRTFTTSDGLPHNSVWVLHEDRHGALWAGTSQGLARYEDGRFHSYAGAGGLAGGFVRAIHEDRDGNLWIGTTAGLGRFKDGGVESFPPGHALAGEFVRSVHEDREGSLWVGTVARGLHRLRDGRFTVYGKPEGLSHDMGRQVLETRDGTIWTGTADGRLNRLRGSKVTAFSVKDGLPASDVASLAEARDGSLWLGTSGGGLCNLRETRFRCYGTRDGLPSGVVPSILEDSRGQLWAGTGAGLVRLDGNRFVVYTTRDGLPSDFVRTLLEGRDGRLWIGTTGGLASLKDGVFSAWTTRDGLAGSGVECLHEDASGVLWIGSRGSGLSRFFAGAFRTVTTRNGLGDDVVYAILDDGHGRLWLASHRGIFSLDKRGLDTFLDGTAPRVTPVAHDATDGMRSNECSTGNPSAWRARDGRLWFATVRGLVSVDPQDQSMNRLPPVVVIEEMRADDRRTPLAGDVAVDSGTERLTFRYTGLSLLVPEKVRFRYLLEGFDRDWIEAGPRREAYYTNVPHGTYRFRVTASNNDGVWSENPASLSVTVPPRFRQTRAFFALCGLGLLLSGTGLYRLRVRHLRAHERQLVHLVDERTTALRHARDQLEDRVRERTEDLARAEEKYRSIFENATFGIFQTTPDGRFVTANPALARMLGYESPEALLSAGIDLEKVGYVGPGRRAEFRRLLAENGIIERFESQIYRRDGSRIWISENVRVTRDAKGDVLYEGTNEDITSRKLAEAREATQAAITHVLAELGSLDEAIPQLLRLICEGLGFDRGEAWRADAWAGRLVRENESVGPGEGVVGEAWQSGHPVWSASGVLAVPITAGAEVPAVLVFTSRDARRPDPDVFAMMDDVASRVGQFVQRRRAEDSLQRSQTMSAMGALVAGVAHEVRNPLFAISASLDAFEAQLPEDAAYGPYLQPLRSEIERMGRLMEELLAFGKPLASELKEAPLDAVVKDAVQACQRAAELAGVKIESSVDGALLRVPMDRERLVQVFLNLLQNAVQHSPPGGTVSIGASLVRESGQPWIECSVRDSGGGFREEDLGLIFEPFFTRRRGGTGLGLSIVQRIVDEHRGRIKVENRAEGGAMVTVRLPVAPPP
jgi:PAS domain S-box-containing protein